MKRKRILSLLLALSVMATMLMAVPLTGYAATATATFTVTDDLSSDYTNTTAGSEIYDATAFSVLATQNGVKISNSGLLYNYSNSDDSSSYNVTVAAGSNFRPIVFVKAAQSGTISVTFGANSSASSKGLVIAKFTGDVSSDAVSSSNTSTVTSGSAAGSSTSTTITGEVESGSVYVIGPRSGNVVITSISLEYEESTEPTVTAKDLSINAGESDKISPTATNFTDTPTYTYAFVTDSTGETAATVTENEDGSTSYSTDKSTFTLTSDGNVTVDENAENGDVAYVKVTGTDGTNTASCIVTVTAVNVISVTGVTVSPESATIYFGQTKTLTATVSPEDADDTSVTWSSSDTSVATVDSGKVTPFATGTATITATTTDGGYTATSEITVEDPTYPDNDGKITISESTISTSDLTAASESKIYSLLDTAETAKGDNASNESGAYAYKTGYKYFDGEVAFVGSNGNLYQTGKTTQDIDGTENANGIRIKGSQDVVAVHLAAGSTVRVYITGGGGSARYGYLTTSKIKSLSTSTYASDSTAQTDNLANYATDLLEYTATSDTIAYISATGDSFISELQVIVPGEADSGRYTDGDGQTVGVIRFLQSYTDDNISSYGFYIVDENGDITVGTTPSIYDDTTGSVDNGFYGDITDIPEENLTDSYYAKPFVTYENITDPVYMSIITQTGVSDTTVTYPEQTNSTQSKGVF